MRYLISFLGIGLLLLNACSSITVKHDYDSDYDFSTFKTYRWVGAEKINPDDELSKYPLARKRFVIAIDKVMAEKGFTLLAGGDPDIVILVHAGIKEKTSVHSTGGSYGYGHYGYGGWNQPGWGGYGGSTYVSQYEEGTIVIDFVSFENQEMAWRGSATGTIDDSQRTPEELEEDTYEIIKKILNQYPPE